MVPLSPAEQKQPALLTVNEKWHGREQPKVLLSPLKVEHNSSLWLPDAAALCKTDFRSFWL